MTSKMYVVSSYGGEWEDSWNYIEGVCSTKEVAEALKEKIENLHNLEISISDKEWCTMYNSLLDYEDEHGTFDSVVEGMTHLFPNIPVSDLEKAYEKYENDMYIGTTIKEVKVFNNLTDI